MGSLRSRRSFLAAALTRAAALWVSITGGLAALAAACGSGKPRGAAGPAPADDRSAPLYGSPRPVAQPEPVPGPPDPALAPSVAAPRPPTPLYGAAPRPAPPKYGAPPPRKPPGGA